LSQLPNEKATAAFAICPAGQGQNRLPSMTSGNFISDFKGQFVLQEQSGERSSVDAI
jgi:hypothetical protein